MNKIKLFVPLNLLHLFLSGGTFAFVSHRKHYRQAVRNFPSTSSRTNTAFITTASTGTGTTSTRLNLNNLNKISSQFDISKDAFLTIAASTTTTTTTTSSSNVALPDMLKAAAGAATIMISITGLIFAWDRISEWFRRQIPLSLKPTVESIYATVAGLATVGVLTKFLVDIPALRAYVEPFSKEYFGKSDIFVKNVIFFQEAFLQLGIVYLVASTAMILKGLSKLNDIDEIQDSIVDPMTGYRVTPEKLVNYYSEKEYNRPQENPGYTGITRELFMDKREWSAKVLMLRNLVMDLIPDLPPNFRVEALLEESFAQNMFRLVQIPTLAWLVFVPFLALSNGLDLSNGVINAGANNADATAGTFIDNFAVFTTALSSVVISSIWSYWNCWKMTQIKYMILPKLQPDPSIGAPVIQMPPIYSAFLRRTFDSSPPTLKRIEAFFAKPPRTAYDELFGEVGSAGLDVYGNSIKYQAWLNLATLTFLGVHVMSRDIEVLLATAKEPTLVSIEFFTYMIMFVLSLIQLTLTTPRTFWNYCIIACMEDRNLQYLLDVAGYGYGYGPPETASSVSLPSSSVQTLRSRQGRLASIGGERASQLPSPRTLERLGRGIGGVFGNKNRAPVVTGGIIQGDDGIQGTRMRVTDDMNGGGGGGGRIGSRRFNGGGSGGPNAQGSPPDGERMVNSYDRRQDDNNYRNF